MKLSNMSLSEIKEAAEIIFQAEVTRGESTGAMVGREFTNVQALAAVLMFGAGLGLTTYEAVSGLWPSNGKLNMSANLMASKIKSSPKYDYRVVENTDDHCTIDFLLKDGTPIGSTTYSVADAKKAGIYKNQWIKGERAMCFARALSEGCRTHTPDALAGSVYVEMNGELEVGGDTNLTRAAPPERAKAPSQRAVAPFEPSKAAGGEEPRPKKIESEKFQADGETPPNDVAPDWDGPAPWDGPNAGDPAHPGMAPDTEEPAPEIPPPPPVKEFKLPAVKDARAGADSLQKAIKEWSGCKPEDLVPLCRRVLVAASALDPSGAKKATVAQFAKALGWIEDRRSVGVTIERALEQLEPKKAPKKELVKDEFAASV